MENCGNQYVKFACPLATDAWQEAMMDFGLLIDNEDVSDDLMEQCSAELGKVGMAETGASAGWYGFDGMLGAKNLREAVARTTQIKGEIIPSDCPGKLSMAPRRPAGVLVGMAP